MVDIVHVSDNAELLGLGGKECWRVITAAESPRWRLPGGSHSSFLPSLFNVSSDEITAGWRSEQETKLGECFHAAFLFMVMGK